MRQEVSLFVEGREVEFATPPQILFTYTQNELTNPSVVKNSYTKTIKIEGTPNNNDIFGHIWDLSRIQSYGEGDYTQTLFDAAKKAEFTLFFNGEIYESGYLKLEKITKNGNHITMDAVLYGGLGGFFYDMTYDNEGNKLKLSDLQYLENGGDSEFDMVISKETLLEAWNGIYGYETKWAAINFAPAYEGDPDNFDTDKCVVNFNNAAINSATTTSGTTYLAKNGYSLGTFPEKLDMWATRDIRSYLVRPVLSVRYLFNAFVRHAASKGYELDLDSDFFNFDNPYYEDAWVTLPRLSEMKLTGADTSSRTELTPSVNHTLTQNGWYNTTYRIATNPDLPLGTTSIDLEMDFNVSGATGITQDLTTSSWIGGKRNFAGFAVQLIGFEGDTPLSTVVTASTAYFLTSKVGNDYLKIEETTWKPEGTGEYKYDFGNWVRTGSGTWKWSNRLTFRMELPSTIGCFGLRIISVANLETVQTYSGAAAQSYGFRRGKAYTSNQLNASTSANTTTTILDKNIIFDNGSIYTYSQNESAGFSGAHVGKKTMLNVDQTPCDWLLSFCKMFNLYFLKEPNNKKIQVLMRGNFYDTGTTVDVNGLIDRGSDMEITPIPYESMWYNLSQEQVAGGFAQQYESTFGTKYGTQRINTGYEFDVEEKKILDKNVFKSAVEGTEKSRYYLAPERFAPSNQMPAYVLQGFKYMLYHGEDTYEVDMGQRAWEFSPLDKELYYDLFPKPQFRDGDRKAVDGKNVLLFFTGFKECVNADGTEIPYWLTDDIGAMGALNDQKPCWIYTEDEYDANHNKIAIKVTQLPKFQRNITGWGGNISRSWDFGAPRQLFIDNAFWVNEAGIYYSFWRNYLQDFYSTDTRVVKCKMLIEKRPNPDMLRKFYWFDNARWRLNKIDEWNLSSHDKTSVEFVRVSDLEAYTSTPVTTAPTITVRLSKDTANKNGDIIEAYVHVSDGGSWYVEGYSEDALGLSAMNGVGDTTVTITVYSNPNGSERELYVYFMADNAFAKVLITQAASRLWLEIIDTENIPAEGGQARVMVYSDDPWSASTPYTGIITAITPSTGVGSTAGEMITLQFAPNEFSSRNTAYITATNGVTTVRSGNFTQNAAGNPYVNIYSNNQYLAKEGGTFTFTVEANCDYRIVGVNQWITFNPTTGTTGGTTFTATVAENTGYRRSTTFAAKDMAGANTISSDSVLVVQSGVTYIVYAAGANSGPRSATPSNVETGFVDADGNYLTEITDNTYSPFENNYVLTFGRDVAKITNGAFQRMNSPYVELYYVSTPSSVIEISEYAFAENEYLSGVTTSAATITSGAFMDCPALVNLNLGEGVQVIGDLAFAACGALTGVTIPSTVTELGCNAFAGCTGLASLYYAGTVAQWEAITKCSTWNNGASNLTKVICSDGEAEVTGGNGKIEWTRIDGGGDVSATNGYAVFNVSATEDWTASTPYTGIIRLISPSAGTIGTTTVTVYFNDNTGSRNQVYVDFSGATQHSRAYIQQAAAGNPYVRFIPASMVLSSEAQSVQIQVSANTDWSMYHWASWISTTPANLQVVSSAVTEITLTVQANTGTTSRMTSILAKDVNGAYNIDSDSSFYFTQSSVSSNSEGTSSSSTVATNAKRAYRISEVYSLKEAETL